MSELTQIVNNPAEIQPILEQENQPKTTEKMFVLKKGFFFLPEQRKKVLGMPLKGFVASMDVKTNEIKNIPIGLLNENQSELSDYLICTLFEKSDGSAITMQHICEMESSEYKKMETKVKEINPFGVFDIKAF